MNWGSDRVNGHIRQKTVEQCSAEAVRQNKPFFGMEWPEGSSVTGQAQCLILSTLPKMTKTGDNDCAREVNSYGQHLGAAKRLAVYSTGRHNGTWFMIARTRTDTVKFPYIY